MSNLRCANRIKAGKVMGFVFARLLFKNLSKNEKIRIISHSMGSAYAKGLVESIKKYCENNNIDFNKIFDFEIDIAPFQPDEQKAVASNTYVVQHENDPIAGAQEMEGANMFSCDKSEMEFIDAHKIASFFKELQLLLQQIKRKDEE